MKCNKQVVHTRPMDKQLNGPFIETVSQINVYNVMILLYGTIKEITIIYICR